MTGLRDELRPYLVVWPAVYRLGGGTWRLVGRLYAACMAGEGADKLFRIGGVIALGIFTGRVISLQPLIELPLLAAWTVLAWRAGPEPKPKETDGEGEDQEQQEAEAEQKPEARPLPAREQLVAALHAVADPHAHLSALAAHLRETAPRIREGLQAAGIPTTGGVRAGGRVSTGVKSTDFPPLLPSPSDSPDGVVVAGQRDNNNTAGRKPYLSREGFWTTPDPNRPHGWHVTHIKHGTQ